MRIVFMGTPDFAVPSLKQIHTSGHRVVSVVTQPDRPRGRGQKVLPSPVKEAALEFGLPVLQPQSVKAPEFLAQMKELSPDAMVVVAFGQLLSPDLLALPPKGCINLHASLLPFYRGAAPIHWAVINGEKETGVTTMYMDRGMDTGDMILIEKVPIGASDTSGDVHDRLAEVGSHLLVKTLNLLESGIAPREPQDHARATYAPMLHREHETIDWSKPSETIVDQIRGMNPWPGAYTFYNEKILKIWRAAAPGTEKAGETADGKPDSAAPVTVIPGKIVSAGPEGILVQAGAGTVLLTEVQLQGSRKMPVADFLRGNQVAAGTLLGGEPS